MHFAIFWDEVGGKAANLIPSFLMLPPVMSTKGACARMETSPDKPDDLYGLNYFIVIFLL